MSGKEEKHLGEGQIRYLLTDILSRLANVIADTQLELGTVLPLHLWRMFQFGSIEQVICSSDLEQESKAALVMFMSETPVYCNTLTLPSNATPEC